MSSGKIIEFHSLEAIMHKNQFKGRIKQTKDKIREISGKLFRDKLLENGRVQKIGDRIQPVYGDFNDNIQSYNDIEDDIRGYGDFRDDVQKSG
jgi:uncharacterized protein YjbJ (UPF0337 family)